MLRDISYDFEKGKMYCIIGKSGAGKTTLLSLLSLRKPKNQTGSRVFVDVDGDGTIDAVIHESEDK